MTYTATVVKVMIASPGDVHSERDIVRDVIHKWNAVHSKDRNVVLLPVGWDTHSSPALNERPQATINETVLADCDLLVAVFWTRLGSPTGDAPSGTVEEINVHVASDKPAMLYFSNAPIQPSDLDTKQRNALNKFKTECFERGLVEGYDSTSEFQDKFSQQLAQTIIREFSVSLPEEMPSDQPDVVLSDEARTLLEEAANIERDLLLSESFPGLTVQIGDSVVASGLSGREATRWQAVFDELVSHGFIANNGGIIFPVTAEGYAFADHLRSGRT